MIPKKNPKANLEKKRHVFFQIGLIISGGLCLAAFEYVSANDTSPYFKPETVNGTTLERETPPDEVYKIKQPQQQKKLVMNIDDIDSIILVDKVVLNTVFNDDKDTSSNKIVMIDPVGGGGSIGIPIPISDSTYTDLDVDVLPSFVGGEQAMAEWIRDNLKMPNNIYSNGGKIYVQFVIGKTGEISEVEVIRGVEESLDKSAQKVVSKMPNWIPGEVMGKPVNIRYIIPINIIIE